MGTSYGTRLALEVMRDHPEILRSVVLEFDPAPPGEPVRGSPHPTWCALSIWSSMAALQMRTASWLTPTCGRSSDRHGGQARTLRTPASPPPTRSAGSRTRSPSPAIIFIDLLFQFLYDTDIIPMVPKLIYDASQGNYRPRWHCWSAR